MSAEPNNTSLSAGDDAEPTASRANLPILFIGLFGLLVYLCMVNLDLHGGGFDKMVYEPYPDMVELAAVQPVDELGRIKRLGELTFKNNCAVCHQVDGSGSPANGCPPLVSSEWVIGGGPNRIIRLVLNGGTGPIMVRGTQYPGTTQMTPFGGGTLSDEQIAAALSYVRNTWGNKADFVTPEQVQKIRAKEAAKSGPWVAADLLKISDKD